MSASTAEGSTESVQTFELGPEHELRFEVEGKNKVIMSVRPCFGLCCHSYNLLSVSNILCLAYNMLPFVRCLRKSQTKYLLLFA